MTVLDHFKRRFGNHLIRDEALRRALASMPLDSNCGADCRAAINAGARFAKALRMAWGPGYPGRVTPDQIADTAAEACGTFITG